jgi:serine/threonine protein kinase/tetratricopeptide (TPR) repeat protein
MSQAFERKSEPSSVPDSPDNLNPTLDFVTARSLKRALLDKLQSNGTDNAVPTPEELLAQWPTDAKNDPDVASLLFQDLSRRQHEDLGATIKVYEAQFPEHKESLTRLFQQKAVIRALGCTGDGRAVLRLPEVGDQLFGFRLLHELGRGSFARVFLAEQANLAGRLVALKVSDLGGDEPQTLAQLQHSNIVPVYSVHDNQSAGLRAVCMPYFGGASLSAVLKKLGKTVGTARSGEQLVLALEDQQGSVRSTIERLKHDSKVATDPKILALLRQSTYTQAAAWIVAQLAEGLEHSHNRGILHRDIKPSNVLLGADGQPMLLDFNLAQVTRNESVRATLGGTVAYMAPEHLRALATPDTAEAQPVDHRADIYALGMVLFEMLAGHGPFSQSASYTPLPVLVETMATERSRTVPSLRQCRPEAPWSLESIVGKCLAPDPKGRYQQAGHLAEDLQRFLDDRPLRYAPELSLRERCRKWTRRHPRLTSSALVGAAAALLLLTLGAALVGAHQLLAEAQEHLSDAQVSLNETQEHLGMAKAQDRRRAFETGTVKALCLVNTTTDGQDQLRQGIVACEETLALYSVLDRGDWQQQPAWQYLNERQRQQLAEDVRELLLLLAWARVATAPKDAPVLREALALLERGEKLSELQPLRALWEDRAFYLQQLGEVDRAAAARARAAQIPPRSARDHYLLATALARKGRYAEAVSQLDEALRLNPRHYWSLVQRGICHRELGELLLAAGDFSRCVGLQPELAWGHYNLGCILDQSQKRTHAIDSYSAAIGCDQRFALAYLNRGLAWIDQRDFHAALLDLKQAAALGRDDALLHQGRGTALHSLRRTQEADAAFALAFERAKTLAAHVQVSLHLRYGFVVHKRLPERALSAFAEVLRQQPQQPQALYGKAMVLVEKGREVEALACFDEALQWHPGFADARRFRAVLLARRGDLNAAVKDINRCLEAEQPPAGITLYAAACVLALGAEQAKVPEQAKQLEDRALAYLQMALAQGYGRDSAATDPDLRAIRYRPEFVALLSNFR